MNATPFIPGWSSLVARVCADDPRLQMLDLCGQGVDDVLACDLSAALLMSRQLQHLDLTFNAVTAAGAHRLAHALSASASGLLSLNRICSQTVQLQLKSTSQITCTQPWISSEWYDPPGWNKPAGRTVRVDMDFEYAFVGPEEQVNWLPDMSHTRERFTA